MSSRNCATGCRVDLFSFCFLGRSRVLRVKNYYITDFDEMETLFNTEIYKSWNLYSKSSKINYNLQPDPFRYEQGFQRGIKSKALYDRLSLTHSFRLIFLGFVSHKAQIPVTMTLVKMSSAAVLILMMLISAVAVNVQAIAPSASMETGLAHVSLVSGAVVGFSLLCCILGFLLQ
ncbi:hypothetical protein NE237_009748 [Protea cynaroides]|uniref:Uncharacterized protein n=1 Tax=Protea cynaroides TaxID=273540 RepID=A0A9Q0KY15_9MAGN|nr:hypothetical protein NE237_009748 [Protea cynaroides]